ncbi:MAG: hypothetical protein N3H30_02940 [Candidatus Micrarchaeota archaeon]|nr:hypothetical protein [Candidatus Micrarchaeota archaeon]
MAALLVAAAVVNAVCPPGAADCFNCGAGPGGIACSYNCTGKWSESAHAYVSCECPQGKPCACYCPYMPKLSDECLLDPACVGKQLPAVRGVMAYAAKINGHATIVKGGTGKGMEITPLTIINPGDTIVLQSEDDSVTVVFGDSIRTYRGEGEVKLTYDNSDAEAAKSMQEMTGKMWMYYLGKRMAGQLAANADPHIEKGTVTICGGGFTHPDFTDRMDEKRYLRSAGCMQYSAESELLVGVDGKAQTIKVLEGKVKATDMDGNSVVVRTGEQAVIKGANASSAVKGGFDYGREPQWWTAGFENATCSSACPSGQAQTPFPGCSCITLKGGSGGCTSGLVILSVLGALLFTSNKLL